MAEPAGVGSGIVVVDKPKGWTSHQVVGRVRRLAGTRKVGHAGTLDPMATGVLLVGVNRATRLLGHLMLTEKEYTATIRLGQSTHTDDAEGDVDFSPGVPAAVTEADLRAQVERAMEPLRGDIIQVPSKVSAIKVNGKRSYARVRAGEDVELAGRPVTVSHFDLHATTLRRAPVPTGEPATDGAEQTNDTATNDTAVPDPATPDTASHETVPVFDCEVSVTCTSGTYIRALARDLGRALGCGGHLTALRRTRVGDFAEDIAEVVDQESESVRLVDISEVAARCFPTIELDASTAEDVSHGKPVPGLELDRLTALMHDGRFLALYRAGSGAAVAEAVFC